jgi:gluconolactonase
MVWSAAKGSAFMTFMRLIACVAFASLLSGSLLLAQGRGAAAQPPPTETVAPGIPGVVAAGTKVVPIKDDVQNAQGAIAAPDGSLLFTERVLNRITKLDPAGNFSIYMENTDATNSFTIDPMGRVIGVRYNPPQLAVLAPAPRVLADNFEGQKFGRPNDLVVDSKGGVYFTDDMAPPPGKNAVYYVNPAGQIIKITDQMGRPNGVQLSPDGKILYVADPIAEDVRAFDVQPDGTVRNQRPFAKLDGVTRSDTGVTSGADGIAIDGAGRLYVSSRIGIQVFSPQGQHLGTIPVSRTIQNLAFAGPDRKTLYLMGSGALYRVQMLAEGYKGRPK